MLCHLEVSGKLFGRPCSLLGAFLGQLGVPRVPLLVQGALQLSALFNFSNSARASMAFPWAALELCRALQNYVHICVCVPACADMLQVVLFIDVAYVVGGRVGVYSAFLPV